VKTLLLTRSDIAALLDMRDCIDAVETAFRLHAGGRTGPPGILGMHVPGGGFHVKAAALPPFFAAKTNANFPANPKAHGLPTIQGAILLFDAGNGCLLAIMDSAEVTALRTGATTGVAARHLARRDASTLTLVGCGAQAAAQLRAVRAVRELRRVFVLDLDAALAARFAQAHGAEVATDLRGALAASDICITCTTSRRTLIESAWVPPGCFVAAVGADSEHKQEIDPALFRTARVVVDSLEQCAAIGDLHHAIDAGAIARDAVHAELGEIAAGHKPGRESEAETILFDSCGVALGDVAAAAAVYQGALESGRGASIRLTD
jgi:ornithine cyclodeaminase/alanine dehydrogenase-like protein (mu-crystallin family)